MRIMVIIPNNSTTRIFQETKNDKLQFHVSTMILQKMEF